MNTRFIVNRQTDKMFQDWKKVVLNPHLGSKVPEKKKPSDKVVVERKPTTNKKQTSVKTPHVIDPEELKMSSTISPELRIEISQARQSKKWTQKELAMRINERIDVVRSYENGTAVPHRIILNKMARVMGVKFEHSR